ncbi:MAG: alpha/beta hydrolase [Firmicutes bacterium]|nr:alpha/beta hydrolase [Bacillota bacterium]
MYFTERYVTLSHGRTRYFDEGMGEPLILLHGVGFTSGGDYFWANIPALAQHFRVLAPDFVGWGPGDRLPIEYSFAYLVDFVREFQDALGLSASHLVGHSMGGWIAALLAYESPGRVNRLVLVANGGMATRTLPSMTAFQPPSLDDLIREWSQRSSFDAATLQALAERDFQKVARPDALDSYRRILAHMNHPVNRQRYALPRRLPHIAAPTLILWGEQDPVNDVSLAAEEQRLLPHATLRLLPAGHFVPTEVPDAFNQEVIQFLTAQEV